MLEVTKIFRFETAHAIYGYQGPCQQIHGHSYELHVTLGPLERSEAYIPGPGFFIDFKELKNWVKDTVVAAFDHRLILSEQYVKSDPSAAGLRQLVVWKMEPSAENMLLYIAKLLKKNVPEGVRLVALRLYETRDSYAEWREPLL